MDIHNEVRNDQEMEDLLALQAVEGEQDDPLLQMTSSSSCVAFSCS